MWMSPLCGFRVIPVMVYMITGREEFRPPCAVWNARDGRPEEQKTDSPLEVLKQRYAKGGINGESFERIKGDIHG